MCQCYLTCLHASEAPPLRMTFIFMQNLQIFLLRNVSLYKKLQNNAKSKWMWQKN